jgi:hypothetical protein
MRFIFGVFVGAIYSSCWWGFFLFDSIDVAAACIFFAVSLTIVALVALGLAALNEK